MGRFVYVANRSSNVSMYVINSTTGALTPIGAGTIAAGSTPDSVAVEPSGRFVYVTNEHSNNVSMFAINNSRSSACFDGGGAQNTLQVREPEKGKAWPRPRLIRFHWKGVRGKCGRAVCSSGVLEDSYSIFA